jgi:hypothetical protein
MRLDVQIPGLLDPLATADAARDAGEVALQLLDAIVAEHGELAEGHDALLVEQPLHRGTDTSDAPQVIVLRGRRRDERSLA